jgi:hypothetical protein
VRLRMPFKVDPPRAPRKLTERCLADIFEEY